MAVKKRNRKVISRPGAKLTEKKVLKIRKEYKLGKVSQLVLAKKYRTNQSNISNIVNFKAWI